MVDLSRRAIMALAGAAATTLVTPLRVNAQTPGAASIDDVALELRPFVPAVLDRMRQNQLTPGTLAGVRAAMKNLASPHLPDVPWVRRTVPGRPGSPDVPVFVINADPGARRGVVLYLHGGGMVVGSAEMEVGRCQALARALGCVVVVPEYRLAPETRFTGSIEDNYAALTWVYRNADEIGADPNRIALHGGSAGGGHAALLAITARDRGEVPIIFQSLVYPMLDDRTGTTRMPPPSVGKLAWTASGNRFGWQAFLGRVPGGAATAGVPARAADLSRLPPTWIGVGGIDLFVQEDIAFASRLVSAGVPVELLVTPGAFHAFDLVASETGIAQRFTAAKLDALRRALAPSRI